jgi:hypothetical protein
MPTPSENVCRERVRAEPFYAIELEPATLWAR